MKSPVIRKIKDSLVLFCVLGISYLLIMPLFLYDNVTLTSEPVALELKWKILEDSIVKEEEAILPYYIADEDTEYIDMYTTIPKTDFTITAMDFVLYQKNIWIYVEDELLYKRVFSPNWFNQNYPGSGECVVTLPPFSEGKQLHIRQERVVRMDYGPIPAIAFINGETTLLELSFEEKIVFSLMVSLAFIAIVLFIIAILYRRMGLHLMPLIYLAITILSIAFWTLCNTKTIEMFTTNWVFTHNLEYISFYLIPLGFISFIRSNWKNIGKSIRVLEYTSFFFFIVVLLLKIFFAVDFYRVLTLFHLFLLILTFAVGKELIGNYKKNNYSYKVFVSGSSIAIAFVAIEIFRYYFVRSKYLMAEFLVFGIVSLSISLVLSFLLSIKEQLEHSFSLYTLKNFEAEHKRYELLLSNSKDVFIDYNLMEGSLYFSKQFEAYFGRKPVTKDFLKFLKESLQRVEYSRDIFEVYNRIKKGSKEEVVGGTFLNIENKKCWFEVSASSVLDADQKPIRIIAIIKDITKEKELEAEYASQSEHLQINRELYDNILEADITEDKLLGENSIVLAKELGLLEYAGYEELLKAITEQLTQEDFKEEYAEKLSRERILSLYDCGITHFEYEYIEKTDRVHNQWIRLAVRIFKSELSNTIRMISYVKNIEEEKQKEFALLHSSQRDSLTGLLHKGATKQKIMEFLRSEGTKSQHAFLMIDVDRFKTVNDTMGHAVGDIVIQENAKMLKSYFCETDIIGRIGGDEFAVLIKNVQSKQMLQEKCQELCAVFQYTYRYEEKECDISISVGVSMYSEDGYEYDELYTNADKALYESKEKGRNTYTFAKKKSDLFNKQTC